jgi:tetratricopeptide (TPR) repeat protein
VADYTTVVELKGAPSKQVASALFNRGFTKDQQGDPQGAIADWTALVRMQGVPTDVVAVATALRGFLRGGLGQPQQALGDFNLSLESPGLPEELRMQTILYRGVTHEGLGKLKEALADYAQCAQSGVILLLHIGLQLTVRLLLSGKRVDEALAWIRRFHELEPPEASLDTRLQARLDMIRAASGVASLEDVSRLVDALLETDPEDLRVLMQFLKPGLELARTNDESVLAKLPEEERKMAREIARSLAEAARQPIGRPAS